jgi:phosphoglycerate kinase
MTASGKNDMSHRFRTLSDLDPSGKRILVRVDLNVPMENGAVTDATRLERILPTIRELSDKGGKVILLAHFGRPKGVDPRESLRPVSAELARHLGKPVAFAEDCIGIEAQAAVLAMADGDVLCLENTRFHKDEEKNDPAFVAALGALGDVYVNDAFSAAHRAHASTDGLAHKLPSYAGRTMQAELEALDKALGNPKKPVAAIVGGAKVSTKLDLLGNLVSRVNVLVIGGGMANTFLAAQGMKVGKSLQEADLHETARTILAKARSLGCEIVLPIDSVVAKEFKAGADSRAVDNSMVSDDDMILDAGPRSIDLINHRLSACRTIVWNGPVGAFEIAPFDKGTMAIARKVADLTRTGQTISVAGGGDTVSALNQAGVAAQMSYISTAGGAFLEWMEGKELPGVKALMAG